MRPGQSGCARATVSVVLARPASQRCRWPEPVAPRAPGTWVRGALLLGGVGYALGAAATTPFTLAANVMTAIPIALLGALAIARWPLRPVPVRAPGRHPYWAWIVVGVAILAWEIVVYTARGSRADHPTFSSMVDAVDRFYVLKAILFFGWLWLCAIVLRAGTAVETP